jgi:Kef-type K+ transport system membrane component KefB
LKQVEIRSDWQDAGMIDFSLAFVLLAAFLSSQVLQNLRLPKISAYIVTGIVAGPYLTGFLSLETVGHFQLINDLALSFIALSAGGALHLTFLKQRRRAIALNIILQTAIIFALVLLFIGLAGPWFAFTRHLTGLQIMAFGILTGAISVARSPSSVMAIINECRAAGPFTDTVMGVTVALDVLVIVFFTLSLTAVRMLLGNSGLDGYAVMALILEIGFSILIGLLLGKGVAWYIRKIGHDLPLFLLFLAFSVTRISFWLVHFMQQQYGFHLNMEPLLICMSAGFFVRNFSPAGFVFNDTLDRMALPIYVLFFCVAGAALNLEALKACWPLAVCLTGIRMAGIALGTWIAGKTAGDPALHNRCSWMAYLTQAGVAIGLAQIAERQFPEIGMYLTTVILAVISLNQVIGPITFKFALQRVNEARR